MRLTCTQPGIKIITCCKKQQQKFLVLFLFYYRLGVMVLPGEGYVPAKSKASFPTLSVPKPFPFGQNDPWFSQVCLDLGPRLGLWGVGWVEA